MGALTSNRKRGDESNALNCKFSSLYSPSVDNRIDTRISKKPRISSPSLYLNPERPVSSKSAALRVYQYPEPVNQIRREVHAPYRVSKIGFWANSSRKPRSSSTVVAQKEGLAGLMGNILSFDYDRVKNRTLQVLRCWKKDKEVIDVDAETYKDGVSDDSSIEEVEFVEDEREGRSEVLDQMSQETSGFVPNLPELDGKVLEPNLQPSSSSVVSDLSNVNLKVDSAGMMLDSISLDKKLELLGFSIHKKLLETAEQRNAKLSNLSFEIEFYEKRRATLQLPRPVKRPDEEDVIQDVLGEVFLPLTEEEQAEVSRALSKSRRYGYDEYRI
ncbi:Ulp1 peptidase [Sarracenia purpurea var. burkii]